MEKFTSKLKFKRPHKKFPFAGKRKSFKKIRNARPFITNHDRFYAASKRSLRRIQFKFFTNKATRHTRLQLRCIALRRVAAVVRKFLTQRHLQRIAKMGGAPRPLARIAHKKYRIKSTVFGVRKLTVGCKRAHKTSRTHYLPGFVVLFPKILIRKFAQTKNFLWTCHGNFLYGGEVVACVLALCFVLVLGILEIDGRKPGSGGSPGASTPLRRPRYPYVDPLEGYFLLYFDAFHAVTFRFALIGAAAWATLYCMPVLPSVFGEVLRALSLKAPAGGVYGRFRAYFHSFYIFWESHQTYTNTAFYRTVAKETVRLRSWRDRAQLVITHWQSAHQKFVSACRDVPRLTHYLCGALIKLQAAMRSVRVMTTTTSGVTAFDFLTATTLFIIAIGAFVDEADSVLTVVEQAMSARDVELEAFNKAVSEIANFRAALNKTGLGLQEVCEDIKALEHQDTLPETQRHATETLEGDRAADDRSDARGDNKLFLLTCCGLIITFALVCSTGILVPIPL